MVKDQVHGKLQSQIWNQVCDEICGLDRDQVVDQIQVQVWDQVAPRARYQIWYQFFNDLNW